MAEAGIPGATTGCHRRAPARTAAVERGPHGLRRNVVEPGFVAVDRNACRWRDEADRARNLAAYPLGGRGNRDEVPGRGIPGPLELTE